MNQDKFQKQLDKMSEALIYLMDQTQNGELKMYGPDTGGMPLKMMKEKIQFLAKRDPVLKKLTPKQINELCYIVYDEAEGWDGEYVSPEYVAKAMIYRYNKVGLIPSRN